MLRGEFIRGDGLVIPNNITTYGIKTLFQSALIGTGYDLYMGLANCNPDPLLTIQALNEPTIGVNGYARIELPKVAETWPVFGTFNGEQYWESAVFTFEAAGGSFNKAINRVALINSEDSPVGALVVALSTPMPVEVTVGVATPIENRSFKYRIYGR